MTWFCTLEALEVFFFGGGGQTVVFQSLVSSESSHTPYGLDYHTRNILLVHLQFLPLSHTLVLQLPWLVLLFLVPARHPLILPSHDLCNIHFANSAGRSFLSHNGRLATKTHVKPCSGIQNRTEGFHSSSRTLTDSPGCKCHATNESAAKAIDRTFFMQPKSFILFSLSFSYTTMTRPLDASALQT